MNMEDKKNDGMTESYDVDGNVQAQAQMQQLEEKIKELESKVEDSAGDDDDESGMWVVKLILILVGAGLLWWLCPSKEKMEGRIAQEICLQYSQSLAGAFGVGAMAEDLDRDDIDEDRAVDMADALGDIEIKNYGLVKLGYFKENGKKKSRLAGIGVCGFVITRSVTDKLR